MHKSKYLLLLLIIHIIIVIKKDAYAQTVGGVATSNGCSGGGMITATSTGLGSSPQYQLLQNNVVLAPVAGDATQFTNNNQFTSLASGNYMVKGKANTTSQVYTSTSITINNGYTSMSLSTPTKVLNCVGATTTLTTKVTGGKANYTYSIATQANPNQPIQTSNLTSSTSFTFDALPIGSYLISVTDNCGATSTGATSITNPTVSLNDIKLGSVAYVSRGVVGDCNSKLRLVNELGFRYLSNGVALSTADAGLFTWKLKFQGILYGQDTDADGYSDANGAGYSPLTNYLTMPLVATRTAILADEPNTKIVLIDACGNQKEFPIINYNKTYSVVSGQNNCGNAQVKVAIVAGMSCLPISFVFQNTNNPADVVTVQQTTNSQILSGFTPGATYKYTVEDGSGFTSDLFSNGAQSITLPLNPQYSVVQSTFGTQQSLNNLNYGILTLNVTPSSTGENVTATVTASNNPLVNVGAKISGTLTSNSNWNIARINETDPLGFWPKGNYTLSVTSGCGSKSINCVVQGYSASITGYTTTPICSGFNYVMNGNFDVPSAYQVVIVSAPNAGDIGQVRDMASTTASLPFNGLSPGSYTFGLRIKGGTTNVLTQNITYNANSIITIDRSNTGGFVCTSGATNGILTISASSASSGGGATLQFALSNDGGKTYGTYQSNNSFSALAAGTYFFKVKDGCGNEVTSTGQITVAAAPTISIDDNLTPVTICNMATGTIHLDVDVLGASAYVWSGPGITPANQNIKSPVINKSALVVGNNNYTCQIVLGAPCNTNTTANAVITVNSLPKIVVNTPPAPCFPGAVDLTAPGVTAGSSAGLNFTYFTDANGLNALTNPTAVNVSGTYYIKGSDGDCFDIKPVTVKINPLPIASVSYNSPPYCQRGTAVVTLTGQSGGTYTSDAGLAINAITGAIDLSKSSSGLHTVSYSFGNGTCSNTTSNTITINANKLPSAMPDVNAVCSFTPIAPTLADPCAGVITATTTTSFPITAPGTTTVVWAFDYGNGFIQTVNQNVILKNLKAPQVSITAQPTCSISTGIINIESQSGASYSVDGGPYSSALEYRLQSGNHSIVAKNANGCISDTTTITILPQPLTPYATISYNGNQFQPIGTVNVLQTGEPGGTYSATPAGLSIDSTTGTVNLASSLPNNTYTVSYAFSNGLCAGTTSTEITLSSLPATIAYDQKAYCPIGKVAVMQTGVLGGSFSSNNVGLSINKATGEINLSASLPGSYTVTYTYMNGISTAKATTQIIILALPTVSLKPDFEFEISKGDVLTLTSTGGTSYTWTGNDIITGQGTEEIKVRPRATTRYTVTATNANGCSKVLEVTIKVKEDFKLVPNNVVTPNGDGKNDTWIVQNIDYYPNLKIAIYDLAGRRVYSSTNYQNDWDATYNGIPLAEGSYLYVIDFGKNIGTLRGTISVIRDSR